MKSYLYSFLITLVLVASPHSSLMAKISPEDAFTRAFKIAHEKKNVSELLDLMYWDNVPEKIRMQYKRSFTNKVALDISFIEVVKLSESEVIEYMQESPAYEYNLTPAAKLTVRYEENTRTATFVLGMHNKQYRMAHWLPIAFDQTLSIPARVNIDSAGYEVNVDLNSNTFKAKNESKSAFFKNALKVGFNNISIEVYPNTDFEKNPEEIFLSVERIGLSEETQTIFSTHLAPRSSNTHNETFEFFIKK